MKKIVIIICCLWMGYLAYGQQETLSKVDSALIEANSKIEKGTLDSYRNVGRKTDYPGILALKSMSVLFPHRIRGVWIWLFYLGKRDENRW